MQEHFFLFVLAFVWIIFAVVQDLRTREVANWLNFSLIAFVLAYRAFYAVINDDFRFFLLGLGGILFFVLLAYAFYYSRIFAGGDAKLLMGLGGVLPYESLKDIFILGGGFVFLMFALGVVYSMIYTLFLAGKNWKTFKVNFKKEFSKFKRSFYSLLVFALIMSVFALYVEIPLLILSFVSLALLPVLYAYSRSVEKACLIKLVSPTKLREGDWLEKDVKVNGKMIKKSVHGLSLKDITLLRKAKKKVVIKDGLPFTPAFLLAFIAFLIWLRYFSI